jgi:GNAT superfamily N-acetyltransferase
MNTRIRLARPGDEADIVSMIHALAAFERAPDQCTVTESQIAAALFGGDAVASCFLAEADGDTAAMALWFRNFSTWDGVAGIHLEDLYVRDRFRRRGIARSLLAALAAECVEKGYSRLDWAVLDWNTDAIELYDAVGGTPLTEWVGYRVSGPELSALARSAGDVSH